MAHLKALQSFEFVYSLVALQRSLMYLREASVKLQGKTQDISSGVGLVQECQWELQRLRTTGLTEYSQRIFHHAERIATTSNVLVSKPRTTQRQQHRANVEAPTVGKYYELTVLVPFLDHILSDIESRFSRHVNKASLIQGLLPSFLLADSAVDSIQEAVDFYEEDLPNSDVVDEEFACWKAKRLSVPAEERPSSLQECLQVCTTGSYPNLTVLLTLFAVLPLSSVSCEQSASALRRLHTYLRCNQTEQRLSSLALIHVHYTHRVSVDSVCEIFMRKHP